MKLAFRDGDRIEDRLPGHLPSPDQAPAIRLEDVSQVTMGIDDWLHPGDPPSQLRTAVLLDQHSECGEGS